MSYVLDGIETAMTKTVDGQFVLIVCPCGWEGGWENSSIARGVPGYHNGREAALRFHYTHCPKAKAPRRDEP